MKYCEECIPINGIRQYFLHCPAPGADTVLLYLHGGPGFSAAYRAYLLDPPLSSCSLVFYDQRGSGKTLLKNKSAVPTFSLLLEDLHCTIRYLKEKYATDKILLLGHSWGSVLGSEYVLRYPDVVSAYIGMGQVVNMKKGEAATLEELQRRMQEKRSKPVHKRRPSLLLQYRYGMYPSIFSSIKSVWKSPVFSCRDLPSLVRAIFVNKELDRFLWEYDAEKSTVYSVPVYYILGKEDWQVPSILAARFFEVIQAPKKNLFWIPDAGHSTDIDNPKAFWSAIEEINRQIFS